MADRQLLHIDLERQALIKRFLSHLEMLKTDEVETGTMNIDSVAATLCLDALKTVDELL